MIIDVTGFTPLDDGWFTIHLEANGKTASYDSKNDPLTTEDDERIARGVHRAHLELGIINHPCHCLFCRR